MESFKKHIQIIDNFCHAKNLNDLVSQYYYPWLTDDSFSLQISKSTYVRHSFGKWNEHLKQAERSDMPFHYQMKVNMKCQGNIDDMFEVLAFFENYLKNNLFKSAQYMFIGHLNLACDQKTYTEYEYVKKYGYMYQHGYVHKYYLIIFSDYVIYIAYDISLCEFTVSLHMLRNLGNLGNLDTNHKLENIGYIEPDMSWDLVKNVTAVDTSKLSFADIEQSINMCVTTQKNVTKNVST